MDGFGMEWVTLGAFEGVPFVAMAAVVDEHVESRG